MSDAISFPPHPNLEQYKHVAKDLQRACQSGDPAAIQQWAVGWLTALSRLGGVEMDARAGSQIQREAQRLARQWQDHIGRSGGTRCRLTDAQFFLARAHGFASWPRFAAHVDRVTRTDSAVSHFERAVDAIVGGDVRALERLLHDHPRLVKARSTRDHRSTLLHYVSANGVEDYRQITPPNIVEITTRLLAAGADVNAESDAYAGGSTTLGLVATSLHPEEAGVQIALLETLLAHGARIDQPGLAGNQQSAVSGCLANGQGQAAAFFASRGAHMNLEEAAGVGRLDLVTRCFDEAGALTDPALRPQLEAGFLYACGYGHSDVATYLLERGVDAGVSNNRGETGLHWAMYGPHVAVVKALVQHGAPVNARDQQVGTPLDWALNGWAHSSSPEERDLAFEAIALLVAGGGRLTPSWFDQNDRRQHTLEQARAHPRVLALLGDQLDRASD